VALARKELGWDAPAFEIPERIRAAWDGRTHGAAEETAWRTKFAEYACEYPDLAADFTRRMQGTLPANWSEFSTNAIAVIDATGENMATRKASLVALNAFAPVLPELAGGSADLTGSNLTKHAGSSAITSADASGNYVYFGVREFGMSGICNGLALHGGVIPYSGTFLTFSDYARNALRMAALMGIRQIFVYTHDSIGLGEDGPTHQPVEHTASLRIMPNMSVWRPCDAVETAVAWRAAIERHDGPTSLVLTRQSLPHQTRSATQIAAIARGGYVLQDCSGMPDIILIATGSEVPLAVEAASALSADGVKARVVSMPSTDVFDSQDDAYREQVLPGDVTARVVIEAGVGDTWWRLAGSRGQVIGLDRFGESAPASVLFEHFGFSKEHVLATARDVLEQN
jgi:transketolase